MRKSTIIISVSVDDVVVVVDDFVCIVKLHENFSY